MGLMYAHYPHKEVVRRACDLIMSRQQPVSILAPGHRVFQLKGDLDLGRKLAAGRC